MISVKVKGEKVIDQFGFTHSDFHSSWNSRSQGKEMTMGTNFKDEMIGQFHSSSGIEEYDPNEEDYEEEEYDEEEEGERLKQTTHTETHATTTTTGHGKKDDLWGQHKGGASSISSGTEDILPHPTSGGQSTAEPPLITSNNPNFLRFIKKFSNITRDAGEDVRFSCEAEGFPPPKVIKWHKNGVQSQLKGDRIRIKHSRRKTAEGKKSPVRIVGSILKIRKLEVLDKGFYTCEVLGGDGEKISSTSILEVIHDPGLESGVIPDFPSPFESFPEIGERGSSIHRIDSFQRVPTFSNLPGHGLDASDSQNQFNPASDGHGVCQAYRGTACKSYIENGTAIYVQSEKSQFLLERKLQDAITLIKHSPDISERCLNFGIPSLCYYAFPICPDYTSNNKGVGTSSKFIVPHRLCREDCEVLEEKLCYHEYSLVKRNPLVGTHLPLPQCNQLPPVGSQGAKDCTPLGLPYQKQKLVDEYQTCYQDRGEEYRGSEKNGESGLLCRPWSQQTQFNPVDHPELIGGHNFCRNPGGIESSPWCFTGKNGVHLIKEKCRVDPCGMFGQADTLWLTLGICGASLLFFLFCLLLFYCCRKGRGKSKKSASSFLGSGSGIDSIQQLEMNSLLRKIGESVAGSGVSVGGGNKVLEISGNHVHFIEEMGQGAFGKVYKGEAILRMGEGPVRVVIKTLKSTATAKTRQDFFREIDLMGDLKHPNVICLLGMVTKDEPRCMLYESTTQGDLHEFLINHSPRGDVNATEFVLEPNEMLFIATQIAAGMEYLAAHHYIHRDLASRNALVGDGLTVKISDFGLAREIYSSDYYRTHTKTLVPIRWMPSEAILYGKFSTESDVWSFGVVMWEIYSYGLQPYFGFTNQEVVDILQSRRLLPCPDLCPPRMYSLMVECWAELPHRRPSFEELHHRLKQLLIPLLGPNSHFSSHIHSHQNSHSASSNSGGGQVQTFPFAPPSCASNNSVSSQQSSNTGPLSNNTNSTSVSTQWQNNGNGGPVLIRNNLQTFQQPQNQKSHCVAYQSTPIVQCQPQMTGITSNGGSGGFSPPYQNIHSATAHFNSINGRISHTHSPIGNGLHSPSPYRVFMESKSTNI